MNPILKWSGVVALVIAIIACFLPVANGKTVLGNVVDTSYFDYFDATTGFKLAGTTFLSATSFSLPSGVTKQTINGVTMAYTGTSSLSTATTTVCALQSPAATSTLVSGGISLSTSSTTASTVTIAKATTAYATTTLINSASVGANATPTILAASTTLSSLEQTNRTFGPSQYLVFGMSGGTGTFSPVGNCVAEWQQI